jgi:hypothetical protein
LTLFYLPCPIFDSIQIALFNFSFVQRLWE